MHRLSTSCCRRRRRHSAPHRELIISNFRIAAAAEWNSPSLCVCVFGGRIVRHGCALFWTQNRLHIELHTVMVRTWTTVQTMSTTYGGQKPNAHTVEYIRRHHIVPLTPNTLASAFWPPSSPTTSSESSGPYCLHTPPPTTTTASKLLHCEIRRPSSSPMHRPPQVRPPRRNFHQRGAAAFSIPGISACSPRNATEHKPHYILMP